MIRLSVIGCTGFIGRSALDIAARMPDRFAVPTLAGGGNVELLLAQAARFRPSLVAVRDRADAVRVAGCLGPETRVVFGDEGLCEAAASESADIVVSAVSGSAGLAPTWYALAAGRRVALANKESLVMAGGLLFDLAARSGGSIVPIDSEHSAVAQLLAGHPRSGLLRLILTASGGPFLRWPAGAIERATPAEALAHPVWRMGPKISIDSASMMNKGLEIIEARWLFDVPDGRVGVLVHPQSIVHALVELSDGSVLAHLARPDMRAPIAWALSAPERLDLPFNRFDPGLLAGLSFEPPDSLRFPCLGLARRSLARERVLPVVLNRANEEAVGAFLAGRIPFAGIPRLVERLLERWEGRSVPDPAGLAEVLDLDAEAARTAAAELAAMESDA